MKDPNAIQRAVVALSEMEMDGCQICGYCGGIEYECVAETVLRAALDRGEMAAANPEQLGGDSE